MPIPRHVLLSWCAALAISACGGGGGGDAAGAGRQVVLTGNDGVYTGTLAGSPTSTQFQMLVLENGDVWAMYGIPVGNAFSVRGFVQAPQAVGGNTIASVALRDFGSNPPDSGSIAGSITPTTVQGTFTEGVATDTFTGTRLATATYNYTTPASLPGLAGTWSVALPNGTTGTAIVTAGGALSGTVNTCTFSGTVVPRASGRNVFDVSLTANAATCGTPSGSTFTGVALWYPIPASAQSQLLLATANGTRSAGFAFVGTR